MEKDATRVAQPDARGRERNPGTQKNVDAGLCACEVHATIFLQKHSTVLISAQSTVSAETAPPRRAAAALPARCPRRQPPAIPAKPSALRRHLAECIALRPAHAPWRNATNQQGEKQPLNSGGYMRILKKNRSQFLKLIFEIENCFELLKIF